MENASDAEFADRALARLQAVAPSPRFEAALLAGYDGWRQKRPVGIFAALGAALHAAADIVWPGAPLWAPAGAFAVALAIGIGLGALLPQMGERQMGFSLEQTPGFTLLSDPQEDL